MREYFTKNGEKYKEQRKEYYERTKDEHAERNKRNYEANKEERKAKMREYSKANKDKRRARDKANRDRIRAKENEYRKQRYANDPEFRILISCRTRIRKALEGIGDKTESTKELVGCSMEELKLHLESQFVEGMSWDNYGEWHLDHIKPCDSFDLTKESEQKACFNYLNLQPLWAVDNLIKGSRYDY